MFSIFWINKEFFPCRKLDSLTKGCRYCNLNLRQPRDIVPSADADRGVLFNRCTAANEFVLRSRLISSRISGAASRFLGHVIIFYFTTRCRRWAMSVHVVFETPPYRLSLITVLFLLLATSYSTLGLVTFIFCRLSTVPSDLSPELTSAFSSYIFLPFRLVRCSLSLFISPLRFWSVL